MLAYFQNLLGVRDWTDILFLIVDITLVYLIVYRLLLLIRGTRAVQILTGVGIVSVAYILSDRWKLYVVNYLLRQFFDYLFLIMVIIFQDEIRRALANMGKNPFLGGPSAKTRGVHLIDEVTKSANILAAKRTGALIVLERQHGLKNYTEGATILEAELTAELLVAIFQNNSPIHDGAVVIREGRVLAAGCFFPVTLEAEMDRNLGTRHRAAVAITQETDAIAVVMSEERGEISVVEFGEITRDISLPKLREKLLAAFHLLDDKSEEKTIEGAST